MNIEEFIEKLNKSTDYLKGQLFIITYVGTDNCSLLDENSILTICKDCLIESQDFHRLKALKNLNQAKEILLEFGINIYHIDI